MEPALEVRPAKMLNVLREMSPAESPVNDDEIPTHGASCKAGAMPKSRHNSSEYSLRPQRRERKGSACEKRQKARFPG